MRFFFLFILLTLYSCGETKLVYENPNPAPNFFSDPNVSVKSLQPGPCKGAAADIIWVVDNSGSMKKEQDDIISNTSSFINEFTEKASIDWRIGLASTAPREDPYLGFLPRPRLETGNPDPIAEFQNGIGRLGLNGDSSKESSMDIVMKHITNDPNFVRENACLAMIFVTDEPDHSSNYNSTSFLNALIKLKGSIKAIKVFTVLATVENGCEYLENNTYAGSGYEDLVNKTKGKNYDICNENFGDQLAEIGHEIVKLVQTPQVLLGKRPKLSTIKVTHKGVLLTRGPLEDGGAWYYDPIQNSIVFYNLDFAQDENEKVKIEFEYL